MKTSKVLVFDIKRFAVHDGHGLRTTVFFKGCPLRCKWCQNPEGLSTSRQVIYFKNSCIHCKRCEEASSSNQMIYQNNRPIFNRNYEGDFDNLVKACPSTAIRYDSEFYEIDTLIEKIKEDKVFYREEGGVTFSGGEPFLQGDKLIEILKRCKKENIKTAIETSFYTSYDLIEKALPYLDLIYIDLKIYDEKKHQQYTGVSSNLIKENISKILKSNSKDKVIIRTPLIPNITATKDNIEKISKFIVSQYHSVHYELLNYNPLASSKYELVELEFELDKDYKMFTSNQMQEFYDIATTCGIKNLIKEN
ncbi:MAG: glycyl-radical enzyme activating protein [Thomasclavelia sp.]|nr:glycyl-radical enzyme activating protein [Thomasclavelia sp.]